MVESYRERRHDKEGTINRCTTRQVGITGWRGGTTLLGDVWNMGFRSQGAEVKELRHGYPRADWSQGGGRGWVWSQGVGRGVIHLKCT